MIGNLIISVPPRLQLLGVLGGKKSAGSVLVLLLSANFISLSL